MFLETIGFAGVIIAALIGGYFTVKGNAYGLQVQTELSNISRDIIQFELKYPNLEWEIFDSINYIPHIEIDKSYEHFLEKNNELVSILNNLQAMQYCLHLNEETYYKLIDYCISCKMSLLYRKENRKKRYLRAKIGNWVGRDDYPIDKIHMEECNRTKLSKELILLLKEDLYFFPIVELSRVINYLLIPVKQFIKKYFPIN